MKRTGLAAAVSGALAFAVVAFAAGDGVAGYFAGLKRDEFFAYHGSVSPWEVERYLTAF